MAERDRITVDTKRIVESLARSAERLALLVELRELTFVPSSEWTSEMEQRYRFILRHLGWGDPRGGNRAA